MIKSMAGITEEINIPYNKTTHMQMYRTFLDHMTPYDYLTLYIHTPICLQRCAYCMHNSMALSESKVPHAISRGISVLEQSFSEVSSMFANQKIRAIYFGGGSCNILIQSRQHYTSATRATR